MDLLLILGAAGIIVFAVYMAALLIVQTMRRVRQWFGAKKAILARRGRPQPKRRTDARRVLIKVNRRDV